MRRGMWMAFIAVVALIVTGSPVFTTAAAPAYGWAHVTYVYDGDTIQVQFDTGERERVRLIGINTPEYDACYGGNATSFTFAFVQAAGGWVWLEKDTSERDQYGRLLRYVWGEFPDGRRHLNEELVKTGHAEARAYRPDTRHSATFTSHASTAERGGYGMYGAC